MANERKFLQNSHVKFLIVDVHREQYLPLKETEVNNCMLINNESYLCLQTHPLYKMGSSEAGCEIQHSVNSLCKIQPHKIQQHNQNIIYSVNEEYVLNAVCAATPNKLILKESGILKLNGDCNIKQPLVTIQGHKKFETTRNKNYLPSVNMSESIQQQMSNISLHHIETLPELEELHSNLSEIIIDLPYKVRPHDVHHYFISYFTLGTVIVGVCFIARYLFKTKKQKQPALPVHTSSNIEEGTPQEEDNTAQELKVITVYNC